MHCCILLHIGNKLKARQIFFFVQQMIDLDDRIVLETR